MTPWRWTKVGLGIGFFALGGFLAVGGCLDLLSQASREVFRGADGWMAFGNGAIFLVFGLSVGAAGWLTIRRNRPVNP